MVSAPLVVVLKQMMGLSSRLGIGTKATVASWVSLTTSQGFIPEGWRGGMRT